MFRDRIFEWSRPLNVLMNAWNEVKGFAKAKNGTLLAPANQRGFNIDPGMAERNRELARAYMHPIQSNR